MSVCLCVCIYLYVYVGTRRTKNEDKTEVKVSKLSFSGTICSYVWGNIFAGIYMSACSLIHQLDEGRYCFF